MRYEIVPSNQFKKDLKLAQKRGYDLDKIKKVITALANGETLEAKYRDHLLTGDHGGVSRMSYSTGLVACISNRRRSINIILGSNRHA